MKRLVALTLLALAPRAVVTFGGEPMVSSKQVNAPSDGPSKQKIESSKVTGGAPPYAANFFIRGSTRHRIHTAFAE
jgi:hypothetical protein